MRIRMGAARIHSVDTPQDNRDETVRLRLATLIGAGWSLRSIAGEAGIDATTVSRINNSRTPVPPHAAHAILRLDPLSIPTSTYGTDAEPFVPRVGTVRRIQALLAIGWTHAHITAAANRYGTADRRASANTLHQPGRWVTRTTHDAFAKAYRELAVRPGPSTRTRGRARNLGYATPAEWDDIDHDPAPAKPVNLCAADGCLRTADWTFEGESDNESTAYCRKHRQRDERANAA